MRSIQSKLRLALAAQLSGRILDCGCGEDLFGPVLRREGNQVVSLDVDEESLRKMPGKKVVASCADMPFVDDYFDAVWACAIIEHVREEALPEMVRVTRPGGRIVAVTPNPHSPFDVLRAFFGHGRWAEVEGHVRLYDCAELRFYGTVYGEARFLPFLCWFFWRFPRVAHVLVLDVHVTPSLKEKVRQHFPQTLGRRPPCETRVIF